MGQYSKYKIYYKEEYDGEQWTPVIPYEFYAELIEEYSEDCGYVPPTGYSDYLTFDILGDGNIQYGICGDCGCERLTDYTVSYSLDGGLTWSTPSDSILISVHSGDTIMWKKGNAQNGGRLFTFNNISWETQAPFNVHGNIMSLIYGDDFIDKTSVGVNIFRGLFEGSKVVNASGLLLPATTLSESCYMDMFYGCTSLETAPQLPAEILAKLCYANMFYGCSSLVQTSDLPATDLPYGCYNSMFRDCISLSGTPDIKGVTTDYGSCQSMFHNCTSLTNARDLRITKVAPSCCKFMFKGCTSLTHAPELPAIDLTNANNCYEEMFYGCVSLNYIKAMFTTTIGVPMNYTRFWVSGVAANGTFVKNANANIPSGTSGIPTGWSVQNV